MGTLIHDFSCSNPDEMKYEELASKVRYYKQETEGAYNRKAVKKIA